MDILGAILFIITTVLTMVILIKFPKRKEKANLIIWTIMTFVFLLGLWTFIGGLASLIGIPFNLFTLSAINVLITAVTFAFIRARRKIQRYYVSRKDILVMLMLIFITVIIAVMRFGVRFDVFAYGSADSARHFEYVKDIIYNQKIITGSEVVHNRYVMYLLDMVFIKVLDPVIGASNWYRAYMLADLFMFFLMGAAFWCWIRKYAVNKYSYLLGVLFTFFYFIGYPLTDLLYGFEYLGAGVLSLTFLLWVLQKIENRTVRAWTWILLLFAANTLVCLSYTQFAPAIIAGELVYMFIYLKRRRKLFSAISLLTLFIDFAAPGALCVSYIAPRYWSTLLPMLLILALVFVLLALIAYAVLFVMTKKTGKDIDEITKKTSTAFARHKKLRLVIGIILGAAVVFLAYKFIYQGMLVRYTQEENGMYMDGNIYREPYANFIILFFPMVLYAVDAVKKRKNEAVLWILLFTFILTVWFLICVVEGYIGSYYFYKMHFIIWTMLMGIGYQFFAVLDGKLRQPALVYLGTVYVFMFVALAGIDSKLSEVNSWIWQTNTLESFYGVYINNSTMLGDGGNVSRQMQEIYYKVYEISKREDTYIPYFGEELSHLKEYYYYLTDQDIEQHPENLNNAEYHSFNIREDLEKLGIEYIFVQKDYNGPYEYYKQAYDIMWTEYENQYGWILKLD